MSGKKRREILVDEAEYRRIRQEALRASNLQECNRALERLNAYNERVLEQQKRRTQQLSVNIEQLTAQLSKQGAAHNAELQKLRQHLQNTISECNERLQQEAARNEERVHELQQSFEQELSKTRSDLTEEMTANNRRMAAVMDLHTQQLQSEMQALEERLENELDAVAAALNTLEAGLTTIAEDNGRLLDMAREYDLTAQTLFAEIKDKYRVELLCPGRLPEVQGRMDSVTAEITDAQNMPVNSAVARREARAAFEDVLRLHQEVIRAEQEWQLALAEAGQVVRVTREQLEVSRELHLQEETAESHITAVVDVDTWSAGDLSELEKRLHAMEEQLEKPEEYTLEQVNGIREAAMALSSEIDETAAFAVEAFYTSQDRGEISQDIVDQLSEMGLTLVSHGYQRNDQRLPHRIHLQNHVTNFEIVITQTPEVRADGRIINVLESDILNYGTNNEQDGDQLAEEILHSLTDLGFADTNVVTEPGFENTTSNRTELRDRNAWDTEQNPEIVKPGH